MAENATPQVTKHTGLNGKFWEELTESGPGKRSGSVRKYKWEDFVDEDESLVPYYSRHVRKRKRVRKVNFDLSNESMSSSAEMPNTPDSTPDVAAAAAKVKKTKRVTFDLSTHSMTSSFAAPASPYPAAFEAATKSLKDNLSTTGSAFATINSTDFDPDQFPAPKPVATSTPSTSGFRPTSMNEFSELEASEDLITMKWFSQECSPASQSSAAVQPKAESAETSAPGHSIPWRSDQSFATSYCEGPNETLDEHPGLSVISHLDPGNQSVAASSSRPANRSTIMPALASPPAVPDIKPSFGMQQSAVATGAQATESRFASKPVSPKPAPSISATASTSFRDKRASMLMYSCYSELKWIGVRDTSIVRALKNDQFSANFIRIDPNKFFAHNAFDNMVFIVLCGTVCMTTCRKGQCIAEARDTFSVSVGETFRLDNLGSEIAEVFVVQFQSS